MELTQGQRRLAFLVTVLVLAGLGAFLLRPGTHASGRRPAAATSPPRSAPSAASGVTAVASPSAVEDLRHDRVAGRICTGCEARGGQPEQAAVAVDVECDELCAEGRDCCAGWFAGVRERVSRRVCGVAGLHAGESYRNSRRYLHQTRGRLLRLPQRFRVYRKGRNPDGDRACDADAARGSRGYGAG